MSLNDKLTHNKASVNMRILIKTTQLGGQQHEAYIATAETNMRMVIL